MKHFLKSGLKIFRLLPLLILVFSLAPAGVTFAESNPDLDFVYGTNHFTGSIYSSTFIPKNINNYYVLANQTSILAGRLTEVYYWPITNQYKANWDGANVVVQGNLEILQGTKILQSIPLTDYVIQYDGNNQSETTVIYVGDEAIAARKNYENLQEKYRQDLATYNDQLNIYNEEYDTALDELVKGTITADQLPVRPDAPTGFTLFSTELLTGFPVNLPVGEYDIRLRLPDGSVQQYSEKHLVVFDSLAEGIGYEVAAEARWNLPVTSTDDNEVIYGLKDTTYYIKPMRERQFNEQYYTRMNNPQDTASRKDRTVWESFGQAKDVTLQVSSQLDTTRIDLQSFYVQQILGTKLGYDILIFDPASMSEPSFTGFKFATDQGWIYSISLLDSNGNVIQGSSRQIRIIKPGLSWPIYLLSTFPLIVGLIGMALRKKKVRNIKVIGKG